MKKFLFQIVLILWFFNVFSQQIPQNNQLIINKFSYVPAYAGFAGVSEAFLGYKQQWLGIKGAPSQANFYFDLPAAENMGIGLAFLNENIGSFSNFYFSGTYAYHIKFNDDVYLNVALSPFFSRFQLDFSKINSFGSQFDPALQNLDNIVVNTFDLGFSSVFFLKGFHFGFNIPKTLALAFKYSDSQLSYKLNREFFLFSSYRFYAGKFLIEPFVAFDLYDNMNFNYSILTFVKYSNFWSQIGYKNSSLLFSLGTNSKNLVIGYAYEYGFNGISAASNGTHEIYLGFLLSSKPKFKLKKLATLFRFEKSQNKDFEAKLLALENSLNAETNSRIEADKLIEKKIDSLKACCSKAKTPTTTSTDVKWVDTVVSYTIQFGYLASNILSSSFNELDKYAALLKSDPELKMKIIVHSFGFNDKNLDGLMSKSRAEAIFKYFTQNKKITPDRIMYEGKGSSEPLVDPSLPDAKFKNERVEFLFNKKVKL